MAKTSYFSHIFGRSPVTPLQNHINSVVECVNQLLPYFDAVFNGAWGRAREIQAEVIRLENTADSLKNELRMNLPTSLLMPFDRRDVLEVLDLQDTIANKARDITEVTMGRRIQLPEKIRPAYHRYLERSIDATRKAQEAVNALDELLVTSFRGDEAKQVKLMIQQLHEIERDTDEIQINLNQELFALEDGLPPVDVIFMYKIFDWTGDLADAARSVGNRLLMILAK